MIYTEGIRSCRSRLSSPRLGGLRMPSRITLPPNICICLDLDCNIPYGLCHCGCGQMSPVSTYSQKSLGYIIDRPRKFIPKHHHHLREPLSIESRFSGMIDKNGLLLHPDLGQCWGWKGSVDKHGYGQWGRSEECNESYAHRVSWMLHYGPIPVCRHVLHRCDNPPCCNPEHLFLGDQDDNMKDAASKSRLPRDTKHHLNKLTIPQVLEIRRLLRRGELTQREIGERFGVTRGAIQGVMLRTSHGYI